MTCTFDKSTEFMDHCMNKYFVQSAIYNNNLDLSGTQISKLSFLKHLYNLETLVLDSCQKIGFTNKTRWGKTKTDISILSIYIFKLFFAYRIVYSTMNS
jgi:hypothetical protein